jgi:hypothetical protein
VKLHVSANGQRVLEACYLRRGPDGGIIEMPEQSFTSSRQRHPGSRRGPADRALHPVTERISVRSRRNRCAAAARSGDPGHSRPCHQPAKSA